MHFRFLDDLNAFLAATYSAPEVKATADLCPPEFVGDVTVSCFPLAKLLRRNPMQLAPAVRDFLAKHPDVQQAEAIKAFVNITLTPAALMRDTVADPQGILSAVALPPEERRRILIEFSAPNTNKPQHL
ncbi:MAG TPA: hypothetical protein PLE92_04260, partial [Lentisphaeria bacterium]|nr:hypothetical protein [Lentisphaeria bacterium]